MEPIKPIEPLEPMSKGAFDRLKDNRLIQAWLVLILALFFGTALAGVHMTLGPKIRQNKLNETLQKVPALVMNSEELQQLEEKGANLDIEPKTISVEKKGRKKYYKVYQARLPEGNMAGWVVKASGQGYADKIEILIGLNPDAEKIMGLFVLEQKETPGLGANITNKNWRKQFSGKPAKPLVAVKTGAQSPREIDAITGATISSKSVTRILNSALSDLKNKLQ